MSAALSTAEDMSAWHLKAWRLSNVYYIQDKNAKKVKFHPNEVQIEFLNTAWYRNVIVKARQLGFSTAIDIDLLDDVLWSRDFNGLVIAHNLDDAKKLFRTKVKYPYEHLPEQLHTGFEEESMTGSALVFSSTPSREHNSRIDVATSGRSGTIHRLHVSEMGKIAAHYPEKALEILTGSFEAVPLTGRIDVESTAEGGYGAFYDIAERAREKQQEEADLTRLDFKLHFHAWWEDPSYTLEGVEVVINEEFETYFATLLRDHGIMLTPGQKAWYVKKAEILGDNMKAENPSTFDEAFEAALLGAYYKSQMSAMRLQNRIGLVRYDPNYPVYTGWDLGLDDFTTIWFAQIFAGYQMRLIDYHEAHGHDIAHYARLVLSKPYNYDGHFLPHDSARGSLNSEIEGETVIQTARRVGLRPAIKVRRPKNAYEIVTRDINIVRRFLNTAFIDKQKCAKGIKSLDSYQKEWDEERGTFKTTPLHNWASHGADGIRTLAVGIKRKFNIFNDLDNDDNETVEDF